MAYFIHYNMNIGGESTESLKDAIKKGYGYFKKHPTSKKVINIFRSSKTNIMEKNVGIMYWDKVDGKKVIVFDSSNAKPGYYNIATPSGAIEKKIWNRHKY